MDNVETNINWKQIINEFASYEGTLISFCKQNNISKGQFHYHRKKLEKENNITFHAISMKEERVKTEVKVIPAATSNIKIEIGSAKIYVPANEIAVLSNLLKDLMANV